MTAWAVSGALLAVGLVASESPSAQAAECQGGTATDFNGDGARDVVITDPEASVDGVSSAGVVHLVYGGGAGTAELSQATPGIPGAPETGDRFGFSLAVFDHNNDGCSDLAVGAPYESLGSATESGWVQVVYGSPTGLGDGPPVLELAQGAGGGSTGASTPEAGDWFGYALAAGTAKDGSPYLAVGVPGEDVAGVFDAGFVHYYHQGDNVFVSEDTAGVDGVLERDDRFGQSLAGTGGHLIVGGPGEAIESDTFSGAVWVFAQAHNASAPAPLNSFNQETPGITGVSETGDQFGASVAAIEYVPAGGGTPASLLAVGSPQEDMWTGEDAGRVVILRAESSGAISYVTNMNEATPGVDGVSEDGDYFGQHVALVNRSPGEPATAQTLLLTAGIPGEDTETQQDAGALQLFPLVGDPASGEITLTPGQAGIPGTRNSSSYVGVGFSTTPSHLFFAVPYGPQADRGVHLVPWTNITDGATDPVTTYKPGQGGIPAGGKAFGAVTR